MKPAVMCMLSAGRGARRPLCKRPAEAPCSMLRMGTLHTRASSAEPGKPQILASAATRDMPCQVLAQPGGSMCATSTAGTQPGTQHCLGWTLNAQAGWRAGRALGLGTAADEDQALASQSGGRRATSGRAHCMRAAQRAHPPPFVRFCVDGAGVVHRQVGRPHQPGHGPRHVRPHGAAAVAPPDGRGARVDDALGDQLREPLQDHLRHRLADGAHPPLHGPASTPPKLCRPVVPTPQADSCSQCTCAHSAWGCRLAVPGHDAHRDSAPAEALALATREACVTVWHAHSVCIAAAVALGMASASAALQAAGLTQGRVCRRPPTA